MNTIAFHTKTPAGWLTRLVTILFLASVVGPFARAAGFNLPEIGDPSGNLLSPAEEKRLGQAFMRSIRASQPVVTDPWMSSYIQTLGDRLASNSNNAGLGFDFFLIDDPQVNAFAGPGGYIGIYTGLITTTESESELASVVAHEIAHVTQNHLVRTFDAVQRMSLPLAAVAIAAIVLGAATDNPQIGIAAASGVQAGLAQRQINFTRSNEQEADSFGIETLAKSGFDPQSMPVFFEKMGQATRLYDSGRLPEFLRTHPVTSNRIADARGRAGSYPYRQRPDSLDYHLLRATLKNAQFKDSKEAVRHFRETLADNRYRNREAQLYGYVLALIDDRQYAEAGKQLKKLLLEQPEQIAYMITQARLLGKSGNPEEGMQVLKDGLDLYPGNYPLTIYYAESLIDQGKAPKALALLEPQLRGRPGDERIYHLLAKAASESGDNTLGHQYLAEYYYASGSLEAAVRQLQIALQDQSTSYYVSAQMTARLRVMEDELSDLKERSN